MNVVWVHIRSTSDIIFKACRRTLTDRTFLMRYFVVGLGNITVNFGVFWILYHFFGVWYVLSSFIGFSLRFIFKFIALRSWVFGHTTKKSLGKHLAHFSMLEAGAYVTSLPLLLFLVEVLHFPPPAGVILTISILYFLSMMLSRLIFRKNMN